MYSIQDSVQCSVNYSVKYSVHYSEEFSNWYNIQEGGRGVGIVPRSKSPQPDILKSLFSIL